ncbi:FAD-binding domain-containing protein [Lindgomyces ingoldianus]|uniref:FAD-binding domain-containing protein n=1 Tax=Lindgomyces ingoldianus TaxID=673940 RepID=A0ACB6Q9H7_9PLEO|nr:FAD-binding domain-containing protein [Lindgomyces ingoldianus]KAF2463623.1 FAD-binding domain-containing protein [Lindgomyces ingoldianus]
MKSSCGSSLLLASILSLGLVSANPLVPRALKVSTDGSCGGTTTCQGSTFGNCCSQYGWCGSSSAYCGTGCQPAFGTCSGSPSTVKPTSTLKPTSTAKSTSTGSATPTATSLTDCLNSKNIPISLITSPDYASLAEPFNTRLPYKPVVIVLPITAQHVQDAVICASKAGVKVQAKSGGHSYASYSSGGKDGSMMIDLQPMQGVKLDTTTGIVTVGGGVRLGNLAKGIYDQGKRALPHGTCPGVGIGGHSTHGGYGHTSRNWGLALDTIVAADVVLANGTLVKCSKTQYPDIFWAIRGAADSFGVIVNFYMQTNVAPTAITYFAFSWSNMFGSKQTFTNTFLHIQDFGKNASVIDSRISFGIYMDGSTYNLGGTFFGTVDEFNSKIKPELLRSLPAPTTTTVKSLGWIDYLVLLSDKTTIEEPLTGYDEHDNFFAKSITVPEASGGLTATTLNAFYDQVKTAGSVSWFVIINLYGGPKSSINDPSKDTNFAAYNDRDSLWVLQNYGETAASIPFINGINNAITKAQPNTNFGAYLNYVDPSLDAATAHKVYYGDALYARLLALKKTVDPTSVFWNPQAIGA